ncbi:hypothetical protein RR48_01230 [Papilio machaon]|uniref:Uncharacterized protein n=1 Tax=Papilio machaon TaxID=76193 RepID=A0A0N1IAX1_PAPMA|nr:hypothetical protein RR48_01230 [Papilio machaon]
MGVTRGWSLVRCILVGINMESSKNKTQREGEEERQGERVVENEGERDGWERAIAISASCSSGKSESGEEEETLAMRLRSRAKKAEPAPKMTLKLTSGARKKRAMRQSSDEEAGKTAGTSKMSTAARGRIRGSAGKSSFLKAAKEHLAEGLESESGDSDPTYRSSYRLASPTKKRTLPSRETKGAGEEMRKLRADNARLARKFYTNECIIKDYLYFR